MNINYFANTDEISQKAADIVVKEVKGNRELLICAATGSRLCHQQQGNHGNQ